MDDLIHEFFLSFGLISMFALIGSLLSTRWKQPTVMGLILVGMLVGPNMLGLIQNNQLVALLAELGAVLLLFSIGLEFNINRVFKSGFRAIFAGSIIMLTLFIAGYEAAILMGFDIAPALGLGAAFSFSSTAIFARLMQSFGLIQRPYVSLMVSVLVIEDIVAVAAMAFFTSLRAESAESATIFNILFSLLYSLVLMGFVYFVLLSILKNLLSRFKLRLGKEFLIQAALSLTILFSFLAMTIGLSPAVGAFLSGSLISRLPLRKDVEKVMSPFTFAFSSYFFVSIGLLVDPIVLLDLWPKVLGLSALFWFTAFLIVSLVTFLVGNNGKNALFAGISMAIMGEFSLLVAKEANPLIKDFDLISVLASMVFITTLFSTLLLSKRERLYSLLSRSINDMMKKRLYKIQNYIVSVFREFEGKGRFITQLRSHSPELTKNISLFAVAGAVILFARMYLGSTQFSIFGIGRDLTSDALLLLFALLIPTLATIIKKLKIIADGFAHAFLKTKSIKKKDASRRLADSFLLVILLYLVFILIPMVFDLLQLPKAFASLSLIPVFGIILVIYNAVVLIMRFAPKKV